MRKLFLAMFIIVAALSACKKDSEDTSEKAVSINTLPVNITQYVDNNYPDASIFEANVEIQRNVAVYKLTLNTEEELTFDKDGNFVENITDDNQKMHHHGHHGHPNAGNVVNGIPVNTLPASITGYVSTNFTGYTIKHAEIDSTCQYGLVTEVVIFKHGLPPVKLFFDQSGSYLMSSSRLMFANLPAVVKTSFTTNYSQFTPRMVALKLDLANNTVEYIVYLVNGQIHKRVVITDTAVVVCEQ